MDDDLFSDLGQGLARLQVRAWRLKLDASGVEVTLPLLRGVWGAALLDVSPEWYAATFEGQPGGVPRYLLRGIHGSDGPVCAFDFVLFGPPHLHEEAAAWAAWDLALSRGLGAARRPARLADLRPLAWEGTALACARLQPGFALAPLAWPLPQDAPCRLVFRSPLRLLREGRLTEAPTLPDVVIAALRRAHALAPDALWASHGRRGTWLELARTVPAAPFRGGPLDLVRYSGRQRAEVELRGVAGELALPEGPGPLAGLLAAACWLGLGKGTVMGMGQLTVEPVE